MKLLSKLYSAAALLTLGLVACQNQAPPQIKMEDLLSAGQTGQGLRAKQKAAAYGYKTLAKFEKGKTANLSLEQLATWEGKRLSLIVITERQAPWLQDIMAEPKQAQVEGLFTGYLKLYQLALSSHFEIDEQWDGLVLEPQKTEESNDKILEAAKQISLIEEVIAVDIKEVPEADMLQQTHVTKN